MAAIQADAPLTVSAEDGALPTNLMLRPKKHYFYKVNILEQRIKDDSPSYKVNYPGFLKTDTDWVRIDSERLLPYIPEKFVSVGDYAFIPAGTNQPHKAKPKTVPIGAPPSDLVPYPKGMPQLQRKKINKKPATASVHIIDLTGPSATEASQEQPSNGGPPPRNWDQLAAATAPAGPTAPAGAPAGGSDRHTAGQSAPVPVPVRRPGAPRGPVRIDLTSLHQEFGITEAEATEGSIDLKRPLQDGTGEGTGEGPSKVATVKGKAVEGGEGPSKVPDIIDAPSAPPPKSNTYAPGLKLGCSKCRHSRKGCSKCRSAATNTTLQGGEGSSHKSAPTKRTLEEGLSKKPAAKRPRPAAKPATAAVEIVTSSSALATKVSQPKASTAPPPAPEEETTLAGNVAAELQPSDGAPSYSNEEGSPGVVAAAALDVAIAAAVAAAAAAAAPEPLGIDGSVEAALSPALDPGPSAPAVAAEAPVSAPEPSTSPAPAPAPAPEPAVPLQAQLSGAALAKLSKYMSTVPARILSLAAQPNWTVAQAWSCQFMALNNPVCWAMAVLSLHTKLVWRGHGLKQWTSVTVAMLRFVEPWEYDHTLTTCVVLARLAIVNSKVSAGGITAGAATDTAPSGTNPSPSAKEAQPSKSTPPVETESELAIQKSPSYNQNMHLMQGCEGDGGEGGLSPGQGTTPATTQRTRKRKIHTPRSVTETLAVCLGKFAPDADGNLPRRSRKGARLTSLLFTEQSGDEGEEEGEMEEGGEDEEQGGGAAARGNIPVIETPYFWDIGEQRQSPGDFVGGGGIGGGPTGRRRGRPRGRGGSGGAGRSSGGRGGDGSGDLGGNQWDALNTLVGLADRELSEESGGDGAAHAEDAGGSGGGRAGSRAGGGDTGDKGDAVLPRATARRLNREIRHLEEKLKAAENREETLKIKLQAKARPPKPPTPHPEVTEETLQALSHRENSLRFQSEALERDARAVKFQVEAIAKERSTLVQAATSFANMVASTGNYKLHAQVQAIIQNLRKIAAPKASRVVIPPLPPLGPLPTRGLPGHAPPGSAPSGPPLANGAAGRRFSISNGVQGGPPGGFPPPPPFNGGRGLPGAAPQAAAMRMPIPSPNNIISRMQHLQQQQQQHQQSQIATHVPSHSEQVQNLQQQLKQMVDNRRLSSGGGVPSGGLPVSNMLQPVQLDGTGAPWNLETGAWKQAPPLQYAYKEVPTPTPPEAAIQQQQQQQQQRQQGAQETLPQPPQSQSPTEPSIILPFAQLETTLGSGNAAIQLMRAIASGAISEPDSVNRAALLLAEALYPMIQAYPQYAMLKCNIDDSNGGLPSDAMVNLVRSLIFTLQKSD